MKIGIDGTPLMVPFHNGTRHYANQLLSALARLDDDNEYVIFAADRPRHFNKKNFRFVTMPRHIPIFKRQLFLPIAAKKENLDVFHYLEPFGGSFFYHPHIVTTIHDLDLEAVYPWTASPGSFIRRWYTEFIREGALRNTCAFIAVSKSIESELRIYIKKKKLSPNTVVIHEACHPDFRVLNKPERHQGNYFLCMGDFSPRKNIPRVLKAFSLLERGVGEKIRLKIIISSSAPRRDFTRKMTELGIARSTDIIQDASLSQLVGLYNNAIAFIYPSLYEGFGIPILEAMACGCPVITSRYGAMREVVGNAALLVNPEASAEITRAMREVINNPRDARLRRKKGFTRVKQFSWEQTARKTLSVYRSACAP